MNNHADKTQKNKSQSVANAISQNQSNGKSTFQFLDNRPDAVAQRKLQEVTNNSPQVKQLKTLQNLANSNQENSQVTQFKSISSEKPIQMMWPWSKKKKEQESLLGSGPSAMEKAKPNVVKAKRFGVGLKKKKDLAEQSVDSTKAGHALNKFSKVTGGLDKAANLFPPAKAVTTPLNKGVGYIIKGAAIKAGYDNHQSGEDGGLLGSEKSEELFEAESKLEDAQLRGARSDD
ncbi:hypothetical protein H4J58_03920 [Colwellia sp. MB3u-70]|uniref:hypothetical protein n=1 Tax=unclassified Colwellia TaxID=196834 RepID=UPI0015F68D85|nr:MULTISPECIES: hypothetical protein [unclassified Colwellia]MBA6293763.1 hypothetical protein [Colwellia sp. MB3u-8]MBA6306265.1 hypothetical protein [Colwellia sp. MB3u-70]